MSNGDDGESEASAGDDEAADAADAEAPATVDADAEEVASALDDAETGLAEAETEADLDGVEAALDEIETALAALRPDEDEEADEDGEVDEEIEELDGRLADLRADLEDARGPYAEDVASEVEAAAETLTAAEWTEDGELEVIPAVEAFLDVAGSELLDTFTTDSEDPADLAAALQAVSDALGEADLDPDEDAESIETLLAAAETLTEELEAAETWDDLSVRETLARQGYYDVLTPKNRKDYPPDWNAAKLHADAYKQGDEEAIEHVLTALDTFESDFMEENLLDILERIAPPEAVEPLEQRAQKRAKQPIRVLGKIGDDAPVETLVEYVDGGDAALRKTTMRALGAIGSEDATQAVANQLADESAEIRSTAARALGLIGDTRAIEPLADVLADDDADEVRASAAWALTQIGTARAREIAAEYADDRAYIVQVEAEKAGSEGERPA
ncbi:MAG: HEAT repeat domain-containing protein [Haloarculaceae archaeon]